MTCSIANRKLLYGVGTNDADYKVQHMRRIDGKVVRDYTCPYYSRWYDMLRRCYNKKALITHPKYGNVDVCEEWFTFSNFKSWMEQQDWEGKHLDKDLTFRGSKLYSPECCRFVSQELNLFIKEAFRSKNNLKVGVSWHKRDNKFTSQCYDYFKGKLVHLGYCLTEDEAHLKYLEYKVSLIPRMLEEGLITREEETLLYAWYE